METMSFGLPPSLTRPLEVMFPLGSLFVCLFWSPRPQSVQGSLLDWELDSNPEYLLEGLMLKQKLQYFGHLMRRTDSLEKTLTLGKIEGGRRRG